MKKSVIIIGSGMGGMAAGIYGQANGYETRIFEMHNVPGGQCCSWKRKGYTFDGCIHHLFGCSPHSRINSLWREMGVMPRELAPTQECASVLSPEGILFRDFWDLAELEEHLKELSPVDAVVIEDYVKGIKAFAKGDLWGDMMMGTVLELVKTLPRLLSTAKWLRPDMQRYAQRFSDPFLKKAFPLLEYSIPQIPVMLHLINHAYGMQKDIEWPVGGSLELAKSAERCYLNLGGEVHYKARVKEILTAGGKASGVKLEDGSEYHADLVISNADGRKTIMDMLDGRYMDQHIREWCKDVDDETPWAVDVFLGVDRDLTGEPSAMVMLLDEPYTIAGHSGDSLDIQIYGFDRTMAPEGKGVIKVELFSAYPYWKELAKDRDCYEEEKQKVADTVIDLLDAGYFSGIREQVEVVDVPTLLTWERYMGGTHGFQNTPNRKISVSGAVFGKGFATLPGLDSFYMVGGWATLANALFANALSGRKAIKHICERDGKRFSPPRLMWLRSSGGHTVSGAAAIADLMFYQTFWLLRQAKRRRANPSISGVRPNIDQICQAFQPFINRDYIVIDGLVIGKNNGAENPARSS